MSDTHAVERTSPYGTKFVGRCYKCGAVGLGLKAALEPCLNTKGMSQDDALVHAIDPPETAP